MQIYCGGEYFTKLWGGHKGILPQKLDHPRKLSVKLTAGKLCVSDSVEVLTILEKEETKMKGQLLTLTVVNRQSGCASALHDGNRIRITL